MELRDRIVEEASKLFFHNGIKSITMNDIASHMSISKRTLYEIFNDKEELLDDCLERSMAQGDREMEKLINDSHNVIEAMMTIYAKLLTDMHYVNKSLVYDLRKYHPKLYKKIENKQKEGIEQFIPFFEKGVEQGLMENDTNFEVLLWLLKAQFRMLMEGDFFPTDKYPIEEFIRAIILNFTRGIATPRGDKIITESIAKFDEERKNKDKYL
ncbi:MAG: TetR/AcrR family transcriptional regulator [Dysgonamonadaceae bacterium]|jgi:AcrR family transcriptional regulator|nr:TetR/AcrR family transcriptional regulator [Dysgonamonadaceae bacterium]